MLAAKVMASQTAELAKLLIAALTRLAPERQQQLLDFANLLAEQQAEHLTKQVQSPQTRIPGLQRGMGWMSEDFNAPLPDEFWLGGL